MLETRRIIRITGSHRSRAWKWHQGLILWGSQGYWEVPIIQSRIRHDHWIKALTTHLHRVSLDIKIFSLNTGGKVPQIWKLNNTQSFNRTSSRWNLWIFCFRSSQTLCKCFVSVFIQRRFMANSKLDYSKALRDPNPQALRGCNSWAIDDDVDFLLELTTFIWNGNYERLEALFRFPQRSSQFEKCNLAMSKFPIKLCKNKHGSAPEIWNSKIPESNRTVFKKGKDFSISNRWNNFTQTPACDLEQNWLLAKIPFNSGRWFVQRF